MSQIHHAISENFNEEVLQADQTVLVDFYADWCGPCRMLAPRLENFAANNPEVKVVKVNVDHAKDVAAKYRIQSIPALLVFQQGEVIEQVAGLLTEDQLSQLVAQTAT